MGLIDNLTGFQCENGLNFEKAISDVNYTTWLSGITLQDLKQIPENLVNIPEDIKRNLDQVTTNFCNLFTKAYNIENASKETIGEISAGVIGKNTGIDIGNVGKNILLTSNDWSVGGIIFDGVLQCEHSSESKPTDYFVQTGVNMSDHMINQPVTVSMSILMSDITPEALQAKNEANAMTTLQEISEQLENSQNVSNWITFKGAERRSEQIFKILKGIQLAKYRVDITTRLYNYNNMVITGLSSVENAESYNGLVCNIQFREVMTANVSKKVVVKRIIDETQAKSGGTYQPIQGDLRSNSKAFQKFVAKYGG